MSETQIDKLTPEQEALIPVYKEKWRRIALSTEPIDRQKVAEAVKIACAVASYQKEPNIIFFDGRNTAYKAIINSEEKEEDYRQLDTGNINCLRGIEDDIFFQVKEQWDEELWEKLFDEMGTSLYQEIHQQVWWKVDVHSEIYDTCSQDVCLFMPELWAGYGSVYDFCISVLNCECDRNLWQVFHDIVKHCGWIFDFEETWFVCDRPRILSFDSQRRLHAEAAPAIQFADGYTVYAYHDVALPEKYGKLHPHQWESQWLLEEENAELRRVLIQGIGYSRICQELETVELDTWRKYTLLRIDKNLTFEPIHLLKMTCPSTGYIHFLRIPPEIISAREAIKWVNWGIDAEDFSVQT